MIKFYFSIFHFPGDTFSTVNVAFFFVNIILLVRLKHEHIGNEYDMGRVSPISILFFEFS